MTALSRTSRGSLAFVLVFAMLASLGGGLPAAAGQASAPLTCSVPVFANEFHYDNDGTDVGEFIEVAGPAGTDLAGWSLVLYNGNGGAPYATINLSGSIPDQGASGFGTLSFAAPGMQNGAPDGFALVDAGNVVQQFLSYEGTFTAVGGPADGMLSMDVGVSQPSNTPVGQSLQLIGVGECPEDFTWTGPVDESPGDINSGQTFATGDAPPTVTNTNPADGAIEVPVDATVDLTFSEPVTLAGTIDIVCTSGAQTVTPTGGPTTFELPHTDFDLGDSCSITIPASQVTDQDGDPDPLAEDYTWSFRVTSGCFGPSTPIHDIQGSGLTSPLVGQQHSVEAMVIADFQAVSSIRGFYIQEPDSDQDADPTTSEGLFVYDNYFGVDVVPGDYVRVTGFVSEFTQQTQLSSISAVTICNTNPLTVSPTPVTLPFPDTAYPERFEGMSVVMPQTLTVSENYNLGRGGVLTLSNGRLLQPTNVALPGAPAIALQAANNLNQIVMDDGSLAQNPDPIVYPPPQLTALNTLRSGDQVSDIAAVFSEGGSGWSNTTAYRIHPLQMPTFAFTNPRPVAPNPVRAAGSLKVSSFNVLNYFLTIDDGVNDICGPDQNMECRGADSALEFTRQRDKLLQALYLLNADVVGLMELENTPGVEPLDDLVTGLNALAGAGAYDYIATGAIVPGDVIKVGLIYKPGVVQPVGDFAILNSTVDPNFDTDLHRPALAQTFEAMASNGRFTVIVNHLKSKGCSGATGLDEDQGDGQSCWNAARTLAANALVNWALSDPTGAGDPDFLIMGDLNSYAKEDPMVALEAAGYTNLETLFVGANAYSYVYFAQAGSLDHSMANASLIPQVSGATTWHINADEPSVLDYNVEFKSANLVNLLFNADAYRTSDHDPLLIGLNLTPAEAAIVVTKTVGADPAVCAATNNITVPAGTEVYYCYTVTNSSDVTLNLHDLVDDQLGTIFSGLNYALTPGSSVNTVAAGLTIAAIIDAPTLNTATWTAYNAGGSSATAEASAFVDVIYFSCENPEEDFEGGVPPFGWSVVNNVPGGTTWTDLAGCRQAGNWTGGLGDAACMSPDTIIAGAYDAELRTPAFSLVDYSNATISFLMNYQNWAGIDELNFDISADGGVTWTTLRSYNTDQGAFQDTPGVYVTTDLAAFLGQPNLMLRWHYFWNASNALGWYAQIDEAKFKCVETPPTAVTLEGLSAAQAPLPVSGLPLAALPAVVSLALGAAYALRRKD